MKRTFLTACLIALAITARLPVSAAELELATAIEQATFSSYGARCDSPAAPNCGIGSVGAPNYAGCGCCEQGSFFFQYENTFFRYHRADGLRIGEISDDLGFGVEFNLEYSPRVTFGYVDPDGFGIRTRWWHYDHASDANDPAMGHLGVDTYNIDFEFFQEVNLSCATTVELFAGLRYNDFDENTINRAIVLNVNSSAYGGIFGTQVNRTTLCGGSLFARVRAAVLMDDGIVIDAADGVLHRLDVTQGMTEIAMGLEYSSCIGHALLTTSLAAEWQNWYNFSAEYDFQFDADGPSDVGFGGIVLGISLDY